MKARENLIYQFFRSDLYRILGLGFDNPSPENLKEIQEIVCDFPKDLPEEFGGGSVLTLLKSLKKETGQTPTDCLEAEYHRLFGTKVLCPSCEGNYQLVERGAILGDITGFYRAFHLHFLAGKGPPDAVKMELAFLSYMALKEAHALEKNLLNEAKITGAAQKKFLLDHLGRWGGIFAESVLSATTKTHYKLLAALLKTWLDFECRYFNIRPQKPPASLAEAPLFQGCPPFELDGARCHDTWHPHKGLPS